MVDLGGFLGAAGVGSAIGQAVVQLELDTAKYQAELAAAEGKTIAGTKSMSSGLAAFGGVAKAGMAAAGVAVVAFGAHAIGAASDLGEAVNQSNVVFGKNAREIEAWAETGADAFGLSKAAALEAASGFGLMLDSAGLAGDAAADMSTKIVQLAGDLASFKNVAPEEALEKLRSGLAGEAEPLRQFGVFLSEAAVQAEAVKSGIAEVGEELTDAQKIQARYNIIFEQTTKAQGDFQRTADSVPNTIRSIRAEFENVSAEVGEKLLPVVADLLGAFKTLIPVIGFVADNFEILMVVAAGFLIWKTYPVILNAVAFALDTVAVSGLGAATSLGGLAKVAPLAFLGFGGYTEDVRGQGIPIVEEYTRAQDSMNLSLETSKQKAKLAEDGISNLSGVVGETAKTIKDAGKDISSFAGKTEEELEEFRETAHESFRDFIFDMEAATKETKISQREFAQAFEAMEEDAKRLQKAMRNLKEDDWVNDRFLEFLTNLGPEWLIRFSKMNEEEQRKWQQEWRTTGDRTKDVNDNFDAMIDKLDRLDKGESKHKVTIEYDYVGFDPTKPGMAAGQTGGAQSGQQR